MKKLKHLPIIIAIGVFLVAGFLLAKEYLIDAKEKSDMASLTALLGTASPSAKPTAPSAPTATPRPVVKVLQEDEKQAEAQNDEAARLLEAFFSEHDLPEGLKSASVAIAFATHIPQATAAIGIAVDTAQPSAPEVTAAAGTAVPTSDTQATPHSGVTAQPEKTPEGSTTTLLPDTKAIPHSGVTAQPEKTPEGSIATLLPDAKATPHPDATMQPENVQADVSVSITLPEGTVVSKEDEAEIARMEALLAAYFAQYATADAADVSMSVNVQAAAPVATPKPMLPKYAELYEKNNDMIGWIWVEGTDINFPVMQSSYEDEEYYLLRNFEKEDSRNGIPFLDVRCDYTSPDVNQLVYGHNINNREMFGMLMQYDNKKFMEEHPTFHFDLNNEEREYEVFAVYRAMRPKDKSAYVKFKYYEYINLDAKMMFDEYVARCKAESIYKLDVNPNWGEELVTLSTCSYHVTSGTFIVVGRRIR